MNARFAAVVLKNLRVELACLADATVGAIVGVVIARANGAVKDETSLLGNTRLDEVSLDAHAAGIRPGDTIAQARARSADLRVRVVPELAVTKTLEAVAEVSLAFGATTAFEAGSFAGDVVWVDVTGCAHLHGGEGPLLDRLIERVHSLGHVCEAAIADGPHVAAAVARFSSQAARLVPPGRNAEAMGELPLAALALRGREETRPRGRGLGKTEAWLSALGIRRVADLQRLPRRSLGLRLGPEAARVLALLEGDDRTPLRVHVPREVPSEQVTLEYGIESTEALLFVIHRLASRLALRLEGRGVRTTRLELVLASAGHVLKRLAVSLGNPLAKGDEILSVLRSKIDATFAQGGVFETPVESVMLRATETVVAGAETTHLFEPEAKAERSLPRLVDELAAELGHEAVGTLVMEDTWVMEDRSRLVPYGVRRGQRPLTDFLAGGLEATRLLATPYNVRRSALLDSRLVARFELVQWWRRGASKVEHYASWVEEKPGRGAHVMAWIELERTGIARVRGYLD